MATSTKSGTGATLWQIDRFELIFYNPRHRRWQYFAEQPTTSQNSENAGTEAKESLHRLEIRDLLLTIRNIFTSLVAESLIFSLTESRDIGSIQVEAPPSAVVASEKWLSYLRYLRKTASDEGVPDRHIETLESWIKRPTETQSFSFGEALTVLSLLPILEDWDTWGCFVRTEANGADASPDSFPPAAAATWAEPFSIVELQYSEHDSEPCSATCLQKGFLKKHVQIEGLCQDLSGLSTKVHHVRKADFFDQRYCKLPSEEEETLYQCYAHLIDPLFAAPAEYADRRQFVIAYPIASGGRIHFLQIIASSEKSSDTSVSSLWIDWQPIHQALWTPSARAFLQDELLRILVSAFQNEAYNYLSKSTEHDLSVCLLNHIYHLLPVEAALIEQRSVERIDQQSYSYHKYIWSDPANPMAEALYVGSVWMPDTRCVIPSEDRLLRVSAPQKMTLFLPGREKSLRVSALTSTHRAIQTVEQQMQYLENLRNALNDETRRKEEDRQKCAMVVYEYLLRMDIQTQNRIRRADDRLPSDVLNTSISDPIVDVPDRFAPRKLLNNGKRESFGRYLEQAYPKENPKMALMRVQSLVRPSLLLSLSEYFETGPAKLLTHKMTPSKLLKVPLDEALSYTSVLHGEISLQLDIVERNIRDSRLLKSKLNSHVLGRDFRDVFGRFHRGLASNISSDKARELEDWRCSLEIDSFSLGRGRRAHIGHHSSSEKFGKRSRLFGICPGCILMDFIDQYDQDLEKPGCNPNSGSFRHSRRLRKDVPYASPYHGTGQLKVFLVEHLLFLPYVIKDEVGWMKSELINCWLLTGECLGSLYVLSSTTPRESPTARLLVSHPEEEMVDRSLVPIPARVEEFVQTIKNTGNVSYLVIELKHWWMNE